MAADILHGLGVSFVLNTLYYRFGYLPAQIVVSLGAQLPMYWVARLWGSEFILQGFTRCSTYYMLDF